MDKPDFRRGDKVCTTDLFDSDSAIYRVVQEPYLVDNDWRMLIQEGDYRPGEALCNDYHVVQRNQILKKISDLGSKNMDLIKLSKPALNTLIGLLIVFVIGSWFIGNYNSLVSSKNQVDKSWSQVETQYQRRFDLIGNLVESVKGAQKQEVEVFGKIADARKQYQAAGSPSEKAEAASNIETSVIAVLPRLQEAYPELKSNAQVQSLMNDLKGTEDGISKARDHFNSTATNYNTNIQRFPKNIFANSFGFEKVNLFKAKTGADSAVPVKF